MDFLDKRIKGITDELNRLRISESIVLGNWKYKDGFYLRPEEADASKEDWKDFDSLKDHWYGKDRHYWFRTVFTIPESYDGKCVQLHLKTQIEEWDDAKNPQFLVFLDGKVLQGADIAIYKTEGSSAAENLAAFQAGKLGVMTHFHAGFHGIR